MQTHLELLIVLFFFLSRFSNKMTYIHSVYIVFLHNTTEHRVSMKSQNNDTLIYVDTPDTRERLEHANNCNINIKLQNNESDSNRVY